MRWTGLNLILAIGGLISLAASPTPGLSHDKADHGEKVRDTASPSRENLHRGRRWRDGANPGARLHLY